jgi:glycopeptide antibiotics resistance protein
MIERSLCSDPSRGFSSWSNRILILAVAGILFLTLYPFRFGFHRHLPRALFPFLLCGWGKGIGLLDDILNVLLFMPFGFGVAEKLRERGKSRLASLAVTLAAGALLSYAVELLQVFIPQRDSGWDDVLTNSFGAAVGALLFDLFGIAVIRLLSQAEYKVASRLILRRAAAVLIVYIGLWCVIAACLQKEARLSNWEPDSLLVVGNSASNRSAPAWKGRVFELEMWDHAVSPEVARALTSRDRANAADRDSIVAYRFSGSAPFQDERHLLPSVSWVPQEPSPTNATDVFLDGKSWLISSGPVSMLVSDLEKTGQFSFRILFEPAEVSGIDARIISISSTSGTASMELRQKETTLFFWFRTPLSSDRARMSWMIPETLRANELRNVLLSFDGTRANLFVDGKERSDSYQLGPGAALARYIRRIKTQELEGYDFVFYVLVFFPLGSIVGIAWRTLSGHWIGRFSLLLLGLVVFSVILDVVLVHVSGREVSLENVWFSILMAASGILWINADHSSLAAVQGRNRLSAAS